MRTNMINNVKGSGNISFGLSMEYIWFVKFINFYFKNTIYDGITTSLPSYNSSHP